MRGMKRGIIFTGLIAAALPHYALAATVDRTPVESDTETSVRNSSTQSTTGAQAEAAAQNENEGVADIVVTARRISEDLQSTPMAVTALSGAMLEQVAAADAIDLSGRAPNVQIIQTGAGSGAASVFIRGIGNNALGFNLANPVGVYVDDVYMPRLQGSLLDLLDLERVEILRGPQGTLYGRDSTVGAVKYVSRAPDLYDTHFIGRLTLGSFDRHDVLLGASVPIIPGELAVKLDASSRNQTGYMIGVDANGVDDGQHGNGVDRQAARLSVLWTPGDAWRVNFIADLSRDDSGSTIPTPIMLANGASCNPSLGDCVTRYDSPYKSGINTVPSGYSHAWGMSLRVERDLGWAVVKSITAYRELDNLDVIDRTRISGQGVLLRDHKDQNQFSQEFQIASSNQGPLNWVGGLLYFYEGIDHDANLYTTHQVYDSLHSDSYAAFLNVNYALFDGFHVEVGGRISQEERWIDRVVTPIGGGTPYITGDESFSESKFTYKIGADYAFTPNLMVYGVYSTGYRPGSFASTYASPRVAEVVFGHTGAETAENFELGLKSEWFDRRLRLNLAAFSTTYNDMQTQSTAVPYNVTATDFRFKGIELEMEARPVRELTLFASGGYLYAETLSGSNAGERPRLTPEFQFSVGGEYRTEVAPGTEMFVNVNNVYTSEYTTDPSNVSSATQGAYSLLGASIGAEFQDGRYRIAVGGKNLTDAAYFNGTSLNVSQYYGAPRTFFVELQVKM